MSALLSRMDRWGQVNDPAGCIQQQEGMKDRTACGSPAADNCQRPGCTGQAVLGPGYNFLACLHGRVEGTEGSDKSVADCQHKKGRWHPHMAQVIHIRLPMSSSSVGQSCSAGLTDSKLEGMQETVVPDSGSWDSHIEFAEVDWPHMLAPSDPQC